MKRTPLHARKLPAYSRGEELMNMITHIVGGALGVVVLLSCVIRAALRDNVYGIISSTIYGTTFITMFTISSVYHGLAPGMSKKVMQVIDHCTIYLLICGTYTPILFCSIIPESPFWGWLIFTIVWGLGITAAVFTAIDLKKYAVFSMICYIGMGWCILIAAPVAMTAIPFGGLIYLLAGGIAYTVGAVIYGFGKKCRYMHSIFHLFVVLGSILQLICVLFYVI